MKTYNLIDKNSDIVIICSGEDEAYAFEHAKERLKYVDSFRIEEVDEDEDD